MTEPIFQINQGFNAGGGEPQQSGSVERIVFSGSGSEYFRIWIVNIFLTIFTLGIYSAWAKVRKTRYFYDNTNLAGSSFEYHGNPVAILKGRIIAVVLLVGYQVAFEFNQTVGLVIFLLVVAVVPWLIWKSLQFKLYNSSYRGIRFGFRGSMGKAYHAYFLMPIVAVITLYLGLPYAFQRMKKFQHEESRFGSAHFSFDATVGAFYKIYLIGFLVMVGGLVVIGVVFGGTLMAIAASGGLKHAGPGIFKSVMFMALAAYLWMFLMVPLFMTMLQNLIWSNTRLGDHQFSSDMKWGKTAFISFTNVLGIMLTLGLFTPFAQIRSARNRLESVSLAVSGSLDEFCAQEEQNASAFGEGMADLMDFDISL